VFFVKDAERSRRFYTNTLGFSLDWEHQEDGRPFVIQVSLFGLRNVGNGRAQGGAGVIYPRAASSG